MKHTHLKNQKSDERRNDLNPYQIKITFFPPFTTLSIIIFYIYYNCSIFFSFLLQVSCLRFLNRFVETAKDARERIMIQTELEEAGFELLALKKRLMMGNETSQTGE